MHRILVANTIRVANAGAEPGCRYVMYGRFGWGFLRVRSVCACGNFFFASL